MISQEHMEAVQAGTRVLHDAYGDGVIKGTRSVKNPRTGEEHLAVMVEFPSQTMTWESLVSPDMDPALLESMTVTVPVEQVLTGEEWHPAEDIPSGVDNMILSDLEGGRRTRIVPSSDDEGDDLEDVIAMMEGAYNKDIEGVVEAVCFCADWSFRRLARDTGAMSPARRAEVLEHLESLTGKGLWEEIIAPYMDARLREDLEAALVVLAQNVARSSSDPDLLRRSASRVARAIEIRMSVVHGDTIRKNASEARSRAERYRRTE